MGKKDSKKETSVKKSNGVMVALWVTIGVVVAAYVGLSVFFQSHFGFGSTFNGVDVSGASAEQALSKISASANKYQLTIIGNNGNSDTLTQADLGMDVSISAADVKNQLGKQNGFMWVSAMFNPVAYTVDNAVECDENAVKAAIKNLSCAKSTGKETEDAFIDFKSGKFEIVDEVIGDIVDEKAFVAAVVDAVTNLQTELNMEEAGCYNAPSVYSDDEKLVKCCDELNDYMKNSFTYTVGSDKVEITAEQKSKWFTYDEKFKVSLDEEQVKEFIADMAKKYNTAGKEKTLHSTTLDEDITVPAGWYGWKIDTDGEFEQLCQDLTSGQDVSRDFVYSATAASRGEHDYGDSYVEVDLTAQHVYVYQKGEMVFDTKCVTGNVLNFCDTHEGAYSIVSKEKNRVLRGPDYETPVKNWMPFHNGEGLHDATWRGSFGGEIYQGGGSHGCVNLPLSAANTIYDLVSPGTPVLVFYTGNTRNQVQVMKNFLKKVNAIPESANPQATILEAVAAYNAIPESDRAKVNGALYMLSLYQAQYGM